MSLSQSEIDEMSSTEMNQAQWARAEAARHAANILANAMDEPVVHLDTIDIVALASWIETGQDPWAGSHGLKVGDQELLDTLTEVQRETEILESVKRSGHKVMEALAEVKRAQNYAATEATLRREELDAKALQPPVERAPGETWPERIRRLEEQHKLADPDWNGAANWTLTQAGMEKLREAVNAGVIHLESGDMEWKAFG